MVEAADVRNFRDPAAGGGLRHPRSFPMIT
jgi:hypothetical protein